MIRLGQVNDINIQNLTMKINDKYQSYAAILLQQQDAQVFSSSLNVHDVRYLSS